MAQEAPSSLRVVFPEYGARYALQVNMRVDQTGQYRGATDVQDVGSLISLLV